MSTRWERACRVFSCSPPSAGSRTGVRLPSRSWESNGEASSLLRIHIQLTMTRRGQELVRKLDESGLLVVLEKERHRSSII